MSRYRYYSDCPVCNDEENFYWVHAEDNGDLYISDDCSLECDKCHTKVYVFDAMLDENDNIWLYIKVKNPTSGKYVWGFVFAKYIEAID